MLKFIILLTILVLDVRSQTTSDPVTSNNDVKQDLIQRGVQLKNRVNKYLIQKLVQQNRQHLSQPLKEEGDKIDGLVTELNNATDIVKLDILESELSDAEYRVNNEINILQRQTSTKDSLLNGAQILKEWVSEEIKNLTSDGSSRAKEAIRQLRRDEDELEQMAKRLVSAQDYRTIETIEVELRSIEVRLYEALRALHFKPPTEPEVRKITEKVTNHSSPVPTTVLLTDRPTEATTIRKTTQEVTSNTSPMSTTKRITTSSIPPSNTTKTSSTEERTSTTRTHKTESSSTLSTITSESSTSSPNIRVQNLKIRIASLIATYGTILEDPKTIGKDIESLKIDQDELELVLKVLQKPSLSNAAIDLLTKQVDKVEVNVEEVIMHIGDLSRRQRIK